ncbi:hypothetical protein [Longitalea luteola]|uniref:hypothetical protein n=1 Tax=Longitalea luteola TaxID=2812563 RepID=UPI001A963376|nr:hypothetical protein [Longitalea luteola]
MREKNVMKDPWLRDIVPQQKTGQSSFTHSRISCRNNNHAKECFHIAADRLRNVNRWNDFAGKPTAAFQVFDETGNSVYRPVQKNDYMRINIPGPGNPDSDGGDWVQVIELGEKQAEQQQLAFFTVRAASNPMVIATEASHFFDQPATSTFVVYRRQLTIMAAVFGRNEHSNLRTPNIITRIRNWLIYIGAQMGLANLQWKALTHGLLHYNQS